MKRIERLVRKLRVPCCEKPFVIWFQERSGSSHLCSILDSHPDIICRYEDFHEMVVDCQTNAAGQPVRRNVPAGNKRFGRAINNFSKTQHVSPTEKQVRQHLYDVFSSGERACGFKFKYPIQFQLFPEVLEELVVLKSNIRIIALFRSNVLKQAISRQNMRRIIKETGGRRVHFHEDLDPGVKRRMMAEPFAIDVQAAMNYSLQLKADQAALQTVISEFEQQTGIAILEIQYEDLLMHEQQTIESVLRYLGLGLDHPLHSNYEKATPNQLSDGVSNFDELVQAVAGTELEIYLDDDSDQATPEPLNP